MGISKTNKFYQFHYNLSGELPEINAGMADYASIFQHYNNSNGLKHLGTHLFWILKLYSVSDLSIHDLIL
jgi:hypothetical protein